jgi:hypothetical protein
MIASEFKHLGKEQLKRRMRKEIDFREDRLMQKQETAQNTGDKQ